MTTPREQLVAEEMANLPKDWNYGANKMSETSQSSLEDAEDRARFAAEQAAERKAKEDAEDAEDRKRAAAEWAHLQASRVNPWVGAGAGAGLGLVGGEARDFVDRGLANVNQLHGVKKYMRTQVDEGLMTPRHQDTIGTAAHGQHVLDTQITPALNAGADLAPNAKFRLSKSGLLVPVEESAMARRANAAGAFIRGGMSMPAASPVSRTLGGAGAGYELVDAYNRAREGDFAGAAKSGLGALGAALSTKQGLLPKVIGGGMLAGAEAMKHPEAISPLLKYFNDAAAERKAAGGSVQHFATAGVVKKVGQELIGKGVDTLMPALKNSGLYFPKVQPQPASKVLDPYRNEYFGSTISDRLITRLGRSKEKGGARFSTLSTVDPAYAGSVWGSGNANAASGLANMQRDYPGIIIAPRVGTAEMHRSSTGVSDRVLRGFQKAVDQGLLPDDLRAAMNAKLAGHKKYVSQDGKPFFEPDIDVGAPDFANRLKTFEQRAAATETLGGEGVSRGRPDKGQIFDYDSIIRNTTEPGLLDVPVNSVGPRLFKLTGNYSYRPELNASYPYVHGGEDLGVEMMMTPHTALFPDKLTEMEAAIAAKIAAGTRKDPNVGSMDLSRNKLVQKMDPGFFHRLEDLGYNEGGEVGGLDALDRAYA